jgi:hypothetical protein
MCITRATHPQKISWIRIVSQHLVWYWLNGIQMKMSIKYNKYYKKNTLNVNLIFKYCLFDCMIFYAIVAKLSLSKLLMIYGLNRIEI